MIFLETKLHGAYVIELKRLEDTRGFFSRTWCLHEFQQQGLNERLVQCNLSFNYKKGTLRGMHYQKSPYEEAKLIRCTRGSLYDVIIDLRSDSPTYKQYIATILSAHNYKMLYVPEKFAHGFITLEDNTEIFYQMSEFYSEEFARGFRWNDPAFAIDWPIDVSVISERDRTYPNFFQYE